MRGVLAPAGCSTRCLPCSARRTGPRSSSPGTRSCANWPGATPWSGSAGPGWCSSPWCQPCSSRRSSARRPGEPGGSCCGVRRAGAGPCRRSQGQLRRACECRPGPLPGRRSRPGSGTRPASRRSGPGRSRPPRGSLAAWRRSPGLPPAQADRRLRSLPGIGVWTSAEVRQRACGDADACLGRRLPPARHRRHGARSASRSTTPACSNCSRPTRDTGTALRCWPGSAAPALPRRGPRLAIRDYRAF